jgi:hypothetical protein
MAKSKPFSQATMDAIKGRIEGRIAEELEDRLQFVANYALVVSPVDTGAYIESFSIGRAGFGGGRSKKSDNKPKGANPDAIREVGRQNLYQDIQGMNIKDMIASGNVKFTLRNRAPHARDVEDGKNWSSSGYDVFAKIRSKFG